MTGGASRFDGSTWTIRAMVRQIDAALTDWEQDDRVEIVLIDGAGERGLCAGGDVRALYDAAKTGNPDDAIAFWTDEYRVNARLAEYPKPIVAVMDGMTMGWLVGYTTMVLAFLLVGLHHLARHQLLAW